MRVTHALTIAALTAILALPPALAADPGPPHDPLPTDEVVEASRGGTVAADHPLASEAGARILARGGNAVDAVIAAALSAGVVQPAGSGLGGGGFAVVVRGDERIVLDFREVAPAAAHRDLFLGPDGAVIEGASTDGGLAVAVPGEPRGLAALLASHGTLSPSEVAAPAIAQARDGFPLGAHLARCLERFPAITPQLLDGRHDVPAPGERVRRERLAASLEAWAETAGEAFHTGAIAADLADAAAAAGGVLTAADLAAYRPRERTPLVGSYRGLTVVTMPPPSSGGAVLLQVLAVLEGWDLAALDHNGADHAHLLAEAFQHAYADRANLMGDPDFVEVPLDRMLAPERIDTIRADIDLTATHDRAHYGLPVDPGRDAGTHHISVIDGDGTAVALTTTINTLFGSKVVAPASGVLLNDQMDDFVAKPGVPNAFGLVGREANTVAAGKKPLSSMTPTVVLDADGHVLLAVGGSGGPFIISSTLQVLSNVVDFGMAPSRAVAAPRMHHQWVPEELFVDDGFDPDVIAALRARGHTVTPRSFFSAVQLAVVRDGAIVGASDPRKGGRPSAAP